MPGPIPRDPIERFWEKVDKTGPCWEWTASKVYGYGQFGIAHQKHARAHRFAYELLVGPIPEGLELDHLCRNRACVNPDHLEPVTTRVNLLRGATVTARKAGQTHCIHGHEFTPDNTFIRKNGCRTCLTCRRALDRVRGARRRAALASPIDGDQLA